MAITTINCLDNIGDQDTFEAFELSFNPSLSLWVRPYYFTEGQSALLWVFRKIYIANSKNLPGWFETVLRLSGEAKIVSKEKWRRQEVLLVVDEDDPEDPKRWLWYIMAPDNDGDEVSTLVSVKAYDLENHALKYILDHLRGIQLTYRPLSGKDLQESGYGNY